MPKVNLRFTDDASIPAELRSFKKGDSLDIEVWAGDSVADETNPGLATSRDTIKSEKLALQTKYDNLVNSTADISREVGELRTKVATGTTVTPDDVAIVNTVKAILPTVKASDLKNMLEKYPSLETKLTEIETRDKNKSIFAASGYKNEGVFLDLLGDKSKNPELHEVSMREVDVDGKKVNKAFVKVKDLAGTVTEKELSKYVSENEAWKNYMPILVNGSEQSVTSWLPQTPAGGGDLTVDADDILGKHIAEQNKKAAAAANPLTAPRGAQASPENVSQN